VEFSVTDPVRFSQTPETLRALAAQVLDLARQAGATAAEVDASEGYGQSVSVRLGEVETIEHNRDKDIGVTVYFGARRGNASTSDFSGPALADTVRAACTIARHTAEDHYAGLADPARLAAANLVDPALFHPWDLSVEDACELARSCEAAALAVDPRIRNSEGAGLSVHASQFVYANSHGFLGGYASTHHSVGCTVIIGEGDAMQRDYWYSTARNPADLDPVEQVGRIAGERTARRTGARRLSTRKVPVLFEAPIAAGLFGSFVSAVSGGSLYRKSSFLPDSVGQQVFAEHIQLHEDPFVPRGLGSSPFDNEGVATQARDVVRDGVVQGYFLGSYSARKLGLQTTGNAGGAHNLRISDTGQDFASLLREMGSGLLVTDMLGQGVNPVTGDYSRGAAGFWVEQGEIAYPVEEITIAGNLKQMYRDIRAIGADRLTRGSRSCGSILVDGMTLAGE
jgi:PmbA protein